MRAEPTTTTAADGTLGGLGYRLGNLASFRRKLTESTTAAPTDLVIISDSILDFGSIAEPTPTMLLDRQLNAAVGVSTADISGTSWPAPIDATSATTAGTVASVSTAGQGSTLTTGQVLTHTATVDGWSLAYRTQPGWGTMTVRDGAGGTILASIACNAPAKSGHVWRSPALASGAHTLHITATGGTVCPEVVMPHQARKVRTWPAGLAGMTSNDYVTKPWLALELIATLEAAGTLAGVVIATGTNDAVYSADALLTAITSATTAPVLVWLPYQSGAFPPIKWSTAWPIWRDLPASIADGSTVCDQALTVDGTHPTPEGSNLIATHLAACLTGRPNAAALRAALSPDVGRGTNYARLSGYGLTIGGDTAMMRYGAPGKWGIGTPGSLFFQNPDGVLAALGADLGERTDPPAPPANRAMVYARDNGSGKTQLVVRFPTGAVQVLATEP